MKIRKFLSILFIFISSMLSFSTASEAGKYCATGIITRFIYNENNNIKINIGSMELYTDRPKLGAYLYVAYLMGTKVTIITNACHPGGGFSEAILG